MEALAPRTCIDIVVRFARKDRFKGLGCVGERVGRNPAADELPGSDIVPSRRARPHALRPVSAGSCAPTSRHQQINSTREWPHTDQAGPIASAFRFPVTLDSG